MRSAGVHRGFTLVEVVVVIGIIILMVALTISVGVVVVEGSEVRQTETVLRQLDSALQEWQTHADRRVTWGDNSTGALYDLQWDTTHVFRITELLNTIARSSSPQDIMAQIDPDFVHTYRVTEYPEWIDSADASEMDDTWAVENTSGTFSLGLAVLDAWNQPIRVVHPGRVANPNPPFNDNLSLADPDGTIRIDVALFGADGVEDIYGIAKNRQILFVSAGPDGEFGKIGGLVTSSDLEQTKDNIYSYQPAKP